LSEYANARTQFELASEGLAAKADPEVQNQLLPDALLRTADCYYLLKDYNRATAQYDKVITKGLEGSDYALFQKGIIEGLRGNHDKKIDLMKRLVTTYPQSVLADDAVYESGVTYVVMDNRGEAIANFNKLIEGYPQSEWVAPSYLKLGLIYFNQDQYDDALRQYKTVVSKFPKTSASAEALVAIRDVYIAKGDPQGYIKFLEKVPGANVTVSQQDSLLYLSAENLFTKGQYDKALAGFNDYLLRFPNGYFSLPAHFYRGESHFSFQDLDKALADYDQVLLEPVNRFTERTLQRAASINYYHLNQYRKALEQYLELIQQATTDDSKRTAVLGILRSNFQLEDYRSTVEYANRVIGDAAYPELQHSEAYFYRARAYWNTNERLKAVSDYGEVKKSVSNEWAAEASYYIALDHFEKGRLAETETACFEFIRTYPSYASWLVRTYLLLADVYIQKDNLFQARATVQSILDNYTTKDQWRALAVKKYEEIERLESKGSKIESGGDGNGQLKFDE
jgi:TolA-binding protein